MLLSIGNEKGLINMNSSFATSVSEQEELIFTIYPKNVKYFSE